MKPDALALSQATAALGRAEEQVREALRNLDGLPAEQLDVASLRTLDGLRAMRLIVWSWQEDRPGGGEDAEVLLRLRRAH